MGKQSLKIVEKPQKKQSGTPPKEAIMKKINRKIRTSE